jgi:glycosyltransferase involved in cell wall biosynthesis
MMKDGAVTVIVPTLALRERRELLRRALQSLLDQAGVRVVPLVVVNGPAPDPEVLCDLLGDRRLRLHFCESAGLPAALRCGREIVDTPWFADLDDDDLLLPDALARRVDALERRPDCWAVVTNGLRRTAAGDVLHVSGDEDIAADPLGALLRQNWMLPGAYLCRTAEVGPEIFERVTPYLERTCLAIRLTTRGRICWIREPTVLYQEESPGSQWNSGACIVGQPAALREILSMDLPAGFRAALRARVSQALHAASDYEWRRGALRDAWRWHLHSLLEPGGWRYLPYTLRLLGRAPASP